MIFFFFLIGILKLKKKIGTVKLKFFTFSLRFQFLFFLNQILINQKRIVCEYVALNILVCGIKNLTKIKKPKICKKVKKKKTNKII